MKRVSPGSDSHPQIAVVLLDDDPPRQVQAEAGALAERLGGEERVEDVLDDVRRGCRARRRRSRRGSSPRLPAQVRIVSVPCPSIAWMALSMMLVHTWLRSPG